MVDRPPLADLLLPATADRIILRDQSMPGKLMRSQTIHHHE
ncbi:hypothetical protein ACJ4V0_07690 [Phreatobacter sp. HK31-P]